MKKTRDLSICIVNYKTDEELGRCVASIKKYIQGVDYEIIVIDNSKNNRWYSGGNNLALRRVRGKYVLFLNPDTYLKENAFYKLVKWMEKHPRVGAVEPLQVDDTGKMLPTGSLLNSAWIDALELTGLNNLFDSVWKRGLLGKIKSISEFRQEKYDRRKNWRTEMVSGATFLVRKKILNEAGGFNEKLKLYYTDADLCRRILINGWEIWHVGETRVWHSMERSTNQLSWEKKMDIYAEDAKNYYLLQGKWVQGWGLYSILRINKWIIKIWKIIN